MDCIASGDESSRPDEHGQWVYAMAFPIIGLDNADGVRVGLGELLPKGAEFLHFYDLTAKERIELASQAATLNWEAALVVSRLTTNKRQEPTRARILSNALPRLQHVERVNGVALESRAKSDRHDFRTRARLLGSRLIGPQFEVRHVHKTEEELTWLADIVVGAFLSMATQGDDEPWRALNDARLLEVTWLPHDRP